MKTHKGQTAIEITLILLFIIGVIILFASVFGGCWVKHVSGNKQFFDFRQNFKYAYVTEGTNVIKYEIRAWKDWENSDAIQIITADDMTIYTHLNRVMLTDK